jgi:hypothetical protein
VVAAVVLLAGVVGGGYLLLVRDDDGSSQVARDDRTRADDSADGSSSVSAAPSDGPSDGPSDQPSDQPSADSSAEPSAEAGDVPQSSAAPAATATCWDGQGAPTVGDCSRPQGLAGLRFVFPSMGGQSCREIGGSAAGRKLLLQCFDYLPDGTEIRINYSQWASVSAASAHYASKGLASSQANGLLFFSGPAEVGDDLNTAFIYQKEPYSASVYAPDQASMGEAFTSLVFGVPPAEVRGHAS